jgi:hypothetical protein
VLLGNGDGTFQPAAKHASGGVVANSIAIADVNSDGQPDLVVGNALGESDGDGTVGVLRHNSKNTLPTTVSAGSNLNPSFYGQAVAFTAVVDSVQGVIPNGEVVTFFDGITAIGSSKTVGGAATFHAGLLSAKTHTIRATYSGDARFAPNTKVFQQIVSKYQTQTAISSHPNPSVAGLLVSFTVAVSSAGPTPSGSVRFADGTVGIGSATLTNGTATFVKKLAAGTHPITAKYGGDLASATSVSTTLYQVVQ